MMILSFFAVAFLAHRRKRNGDALAPCGFSPWIANRKTLRSAAILVFASPDRRDPEVHANGPPIRLSEQAARKSNCETAGTPARTPRARNRYEQNRLERTCATACHCRDGKHQFRARFVCAKVQPATQCKIRVDVQWPEINARLFLVLCRVCHSSAQKLRRSSSCLPLASTSRIQCGCLPRPDHV
jgi:hypothetical protein